MTLVEELEQMEEGDMAALLVDTAIGGDDATKQRLIRALDEFDNPLDVLGIKVLAEVEARRRGPEAEAALGALPERPSEMKMRANARPYDPLCFQNPDCDCSACVEMRRIEAEELPVKGAQSP